MALIMHPSLAMHPGEWIKTELLEPKAIGVSNLAAAFGVSRQAVSALLNGRAALSAEMAIRFEKLFGIKADTLCRMQVAYDLAHARAHSKNIKVDQSQLAA